MAVKPAKKLILAAPRGFCAGVDRAIRIVEVALEKYGAPVYVRHQIVHNKRVVDDLAAKGAVFVKELDEVPTGAPVIFSAHGVAKSVHENADRLNMIAIDATCPLVTKVHIEADRHVKNGRHILLIGHAGHPEVTGTMGQVKDGEMSLVETVEDAATIEPPENVNLAFASQTTLSTDETAEIISILQHAYLISVGLFGWLFWGIVPGLISVVGILLIILAGVIIVIAQQQPEEKN